MTKQELDHIFRTEDPPALEHNEKPMHPAWVLAILLFILAFMCSVFPGCSTTDGTNQISAGWETVKSRTEIGLGMKVDGNSIAFPILIRWLARPQPDDPERIEQTIIESDPPFTPASKQPVAP